MRSSTYFGSGRLDEAELHRLQLQHQILTTGMGGILPEQDNPARFRCVLDVGCGTGDWLLDLASSYPEIPELVGIDIDRSLLKAATIQAESRQLGQRVHFHLLDALRPLEWPKHSFDLINQRFGASWIRQWEWAPLLLEYRRASRPGGVIRVTEFDIGTSNSPALEQLAELWVQAFAQAGNFFLPQRDGLSCQLVPLLQQAGLQEVQQRVYPLECRAGMAYGELFAQNVKQLSQTLSPFLHKWAQLPAYYPRLRRKALADLSSPQFVATWTVTTAWGITPSSIS